jgi:Holliday junction resolvase
MSSKSYTKGYMFEVAIKAYFVALGYFVVRSSGSHTPVDLVVCKLGDGAPETIFVQCKTMAKYLSKKDEKVLHDLGMEAHCRVLLAYKSPQPKGRQYEFRNLIEDYNEETQSEMSGM